MNDIRDKDKQEAPDKDQDLVVTIVNEDNGRKYSLHVGRGLTIDKIIEKMYKEFKTQRGPGDRLHCEADGEDVFAFSDVRLRDYLAEGHCPDLIWLFAGDTGGALC